MKARFNLYRFLSQGIIVASFHIHGENGLRIDSVSVFYCYLWCGSHLSTLSVFRSVTFAKGKVAYACFIWKSCMQLLLVNRLFHDSQFDIGHCTIMYFQSSTTLIDVSTVLYFADRTEATNKHNNSFLLLFVDVSGFVLYFVRV